MKFIKRLFFIILLVLGLFVAYKLKQMYADVQHVLQYEGLVKEVLAEQDTLANEELVLAMIYTETKGHADDLMQSSESATGQVNTITDNRESIRQGVTILSENIHRANQLGVDVWTAVQAYNFGQGYLDYVVAHGGVNSIDNATTYSREVVARSLGNETGETYFYYHPIALRYGGRLYVNGGNIFYARQVKLNLYLMRLMRYFIE